MLNAVKKIGIVKRSKQVAIPKAKSFTEGDVVNALRSTVPRPSMPLHRGTQHEQTFDFFRNEIGENNSELPKRKELGRKAAVYVLREMPVEFGWDASKGEWGEHNKIFNKPRILHQPVEAAMDFDIESLIEWCLFRPITAEHPAWMRNAFPSRSPLDLELLIEHFTTTEQADKLFVVLSMYLKQPAVKIDEKVKMFQTHLNKFNGYEAERTSLVADLFDAVYFRETYMKDESLGKVKEELLKLAPKEKTSWVHHKAAIKAARDAGEGSEEEFENIVKVPSVRYFNALLRVGGFKGKEFEVMVSFSIRI